MASGKNRGVTTPRFHRSTFSPLVASIAVTLVLAACASAATPAPTSVPVADTPPPSPRETSPPTDPPITEMDIGRQVIDAAQEAGLVTVINTTIDSNIGDDNPHETIRAWLDFTEQRVRIEGWLDGEPLSVGMTVDGVTVEYSRSSNQFDEYLARFFGMSLEEAKNTLPQHLSNPTLLGLVPLSGALVHTRGKLRPMGDGQWQDRPATVWEADFSEGPEGYDSTRTTIYLEPETFRPLGQEVRFTSQDSQVPKITMSVTYRLEFMALEDAPPGIFEPGRIFHPDGPDPTPLPTVGPPPPALPTLPALDLPPTATESSLLKMMENLPASFSEEGVWFADYSRAWELAGLPPQPSTVAGFVALSDDEKDAYQAARRGIIFGPHLLMAANQQAREWEELFGFSGFGVSLAAGTGQDSISLFGTAYLEGDIDSEDFGQRLLDLGYQMKSVNDGSYYAIRDDRDIDPGSPTRRAGVRAQMNRVFLADGVLSASPDTDPIVEVAAAASGDTAILRDDPIFSRLADSLGDTLSAALLTRPTFLEPQGRPPLGLDTYQKPEDWGEIHRWEALGSGYAATEDSRWWGVSLYYPNSEAAESDAPEIVDRMNGYRTAITPLMFPNMSDEGLASAAERPYIINEFCASLTPIYASDETDSILTVWCQMSGPPNNRWHTMLDMRDLGFLLP